MLHMPSTLTGCHTTDHLCGFCRTTAKNSQLSCLRTYEGSLELPYCIAPPTTSRRMPKKKGIKGRYETLGLITCWIIPKVLDLLRDLPTYTYNSEIHTTTNGMEFERTLSWPPQLQAIHIGPKCQGNFGPALQLSTRSWLNSPEIIVRRTAENMRIALKSSRGRF